MKLFEITWVSNASPTWQTELQSARTKMEAKGAIRWREMSKAGVKKFVDVKEVEYDDLMQRGYQIHQVAG